MYAPSTPPGGACKILTLGLRLRALLGSVASAADAGVRWLIPFWPPRVSGALPVVALLGLGAWSSAEATSAALAARPEPQDATVAELVDGGSFGWVRVTGLLSGPHVDNSVYAEEDVHYLRIRDEPHDHENTEVTPPGQRQTIFALRTGGGPLRYFYVLRDPDDVDAAVVMRSARGADDFPSSGIVSVAGIITTDATRMRIVLAEEELAGAVAGTHHPTERLLAEGAEPIVPDISYVPAVVMATLAGVLLISLLAGYPIFRRRPIGTAPPEGSRLALGEDLPATMRGRVATPHGALRLRGEPVWLTWMAAREALRTEWQYWARPLGDLRPAHADQEPARLVLHSPHGSLFVPIGAMGGTLQVEGGDVATTRELRPALRIKAAELDATLTFGDAGDRDLALAELDPARSSVPPAEGTPLSRSAPAPAPARTSRPSPSAVRAAVGFLALMGLVAAGTGIAGFSAATPAPDVVAAGFILVAHLLAGALLVALADGVRRARSWANELGPTLCAIGLLVAVVVAVGGSICGGWLMPALAACPSVSPISTAVALIAGVGFALSLWTITRLESRR